MKIFLFFFFISLNAIAKHDLSKIKVGNEAPNYLYLRAVIYWTHWGYMLMLRGDDRNFLTMETLPLVGHLYFILFTFVFYFWHLLPVSSLSSKWRYYFLYFFFLCFQALLLMKRAWWKYSNYHLQPWGKKPSRISIK